MGHRVPEVLGLWGIYPRQLTEAWPGVTWLSPLPGRSREISGSLGHWRGQNRSADEAGMGQDPAPLGFACWGQDDLCPLTSQCLDTAVLVAPDSRPVASCHLLVLALPVPQHCTVCPHLSPVSMLSHLALSRTLEQHLKPMPASEQRHTALPLT